MYSLHLTHPKWTHTRSSGQPCYSVRGSSWGFGALLKDTSVVVLKEERVLVIHSPTNNPCRTRDSNPQPLNYESDSLTIRPRLPHNIFIMYIYCLKSSVKFPQSVMIWAAMSSAGVGPLCFLKSTVNAAIYQEILEHFMLPSADKLYGDADFIFQQDLAPAHTAKGTKSWFNDHGVTVLDWPANSPDLNPIENLWGIVKRKMRDTRPNNADELKATVKETWASIPPQQCHKLITSMPRRIEAVINAKRAPTKYWVHIQ